MASVKISAAGKVTLYFRSGNKDVSKNILPFLHETVELSPGVTVKSLFLVLKNNPIFLQSLSHIHSPALVEEGLKRKSSNNIEKKAIIEFGWYSENFDAKELAKIHPIPKVRGSIVKKGKELSFGLDFLPASEIRHCKIKIIEELPGESIRAKISPTLGQLLYALMWELSFWGSPEVRDKQRP